MVQPPAVVQHEPVAHGLGEQLPPLVHTPEQLAWVTNVHEPETQQVPLGCGQGFGTQIAPPVHVAEQLGWVVTEQVPAAVQHEPVAHGSGEHVPPAKNVPPPDVHAVCVPTLQVVPVQHEPVITPTVAPPGVGMVMRNEAGPPACARHRLTETLPDAGATSLVKRKLNIEPQRSTLALKSLPPMFASVWLSVTEEVPDHVGVLPVCAGPVQLTSVLEAPPPETAQSSAARSAGLPAFGAPTASTS